MTYRVCCSAWLLLAPAVVQRRSNHVEPGGAAAAALGQPADARRFSYIAIDEPPAADVGVDADVDDAVAGGGGGSRGESLLRRNPEASSSRMVGQRVSPGHVRDTLARVAQTSRP